MKMGIPYYVKGKAYDFLAEQVTGYPWIHIFMV